jgi:hypothetical protein
MAGSCLPFDDPSLDFGTELGIVGAFPFEEGAELA